jgi:tripartite-type tricarboxylate transporter receptor subunit TctC
VPTIAESTPLKDYDFGGVQAFFVKAGTSQAIVERLNASVRKAFANKNLAAKLLDVTASDLGPNTSEQMGEKVRGDIRKLGAAIKTADIKAQ